MGMNGWCLESQSLFPPRQIFTMDLFLLEIQSACLVFYKAMTLFWSSGSINCPQARNCHISGTQAMDPIVAVAQGTMIMAMIHRALGMEMIMRTITTVVRVAEMTTRTAITVGQGVELIAAMTIATKTAVVRGAEAITATTMRMMIAAALAVEID